MQQTNNWYSSKWAIVFYHLLTWLVTLFLPYLMRPVLEQQPSSAVNISGNAFSKGELHAPPPGRRDDTSAFFGSRKEGFENHRKDRGPGPHSGMGPAFFANVAMSLSLLWIALFYLNAYLLIPKLIYHRKLVSYILLQLLIILSISVSFGYLFKFHSMGNGNRFPMPLLFNVFPFLFVQAGSLAFRMIVDKIKEEKLMKEKENEGLKTELSFLRSQISPHFIFNVLNNMVSLARKKSDLLEPSLIRLSGLMRYMLYESDETRVLLSKEIEYLQSYIDLQTQRFGNDIIIIVDIEMSDDNYFIEPMLLIPFVENAFKHSASSIYKPTIAIGLKMIEGVLNLTVQNHFDSTFNDSMSTVDPTSGIGLNNVKRRLSLLYGNNHSLLITANNGIYIVSLQITLV
jgi:two-component system LytT family sensor kinase